MLADIASGEVDTADVFFLVALILFLVAAILNFVRHPSSWLAVPIVDLGLAAVALALLVL